MTVWVVTAGCYSSSGITGVYATAEAAMGEQAQTVRGYDTDNKYIKVPVQWRHDPSNGSWSNNGDWDDAVTIEPYEVRGQ